MSLAEIQVEIEQSLIHIEKNNTQIMWNAVETAADRAADDKTRHVLFRRAPTGEEITAVPTMGHLKIQKRRIDS